MKLQVFTAPTLPEAMARVKSAIGRDAVIYHTRKYTVRRMLGILRREVVEITAGRDGPRRAGPVAPRATVGSTIDLATRSKQLLQNPVVAEAVSTGLTTELTCLKDMVKGLVNQFQTLKAPQIPQELTEPYLKLLENGVAEPTAQDIILSLHRQLRPEQLLNTAFVQDRLVGQLEKMLKLSGPIGRAKAKGPHVVALIGPTGVGKTTTIAKLAAHLKLNEGKRVGLITLDTYRIAAVDQLKRYADIIGSPLRVVTSGSELAGAIASMDNCEFVLIDTAGRSPNDSMQISELRSVLCAAKPDETHLVLSATSSDRCLERVLQRFGAVRFDKIIFTKLDEASQIGVLLNVVRGQDKALSYVTTGQSVPVDIEIGEGRRLAQLMLGGSL
ncbi:MAG: flagellar biosynthesis protein FlhF [Tepidisphaeraceae bacterium]